VAEISAAHWAALNGTLQFEKAGSIEVEFQVLPKGARRIFGKVIRELYARAHAT